MRRRRREGEEEREGNLASRIAHVFKQEEIDKHQRKERRLFIRTLLICGAGARRPTCITADQSLEVCSVCDVAVRIKCCSIW
jgi:hypothetical protein